MIEYKAVIYQEGMLGSLLLGQSKVNPIRFSEFLNDNASDGWEVVTMEKDIRRMLLLWKREGYVVIMKREKGMKMKVMKIASIITGVILALFAILLLAQMWGNVMPWDTFMKLTVTAAVIIVATFGLALLYREYMEEKSMKEDKYLD